MTADAEAWGTTDNWLLKKTGDIAQEPSEKDNEESPIDENSAKEEPNEENPSEENSIENEITTDNENVEIEQESSENDFNSDRTVDSTLKPDLSANDLIYSSMLPSTGSKKLFT